MISPSPPFWKDRIHASAIHLTLSVAVASLAGLLVFGLWYPYPYREISGGRELFLIVVTVDVILGPLLTLVIFDRRKPGRELKKDIAIVVLMQISALVYGLWTVAMARPVHMVFEYDRFRIVHAIEVDTSLTAQLSPKIVNPLPLTGPTLLALRAFKDDKEKMDATMAALQGVSLASRTDLWRPYEEAAVDILQAAKPATQLLTRFAPRSAEIARVLKEAKRTPENVVYLPLVGRKSFWTVFLDPVTAQVLITMPLDSF